MTFYAYVYKDPRNGEPFYVGKGRGTRSEDHLSKSHNREMNFKIKKLLREGFQPLIEIHHQETEAMAFDFERELIKQFGRKDLGQTGLESIAYPRDKAQSFLQRLTELLQAGLAATAVPAAHPFAAATQETAAVEAAQEPPLDSPAKPEQGATVSAEQTQRQPEFADLGLHVRSLRASLTSCGAHLALRVSPV